MNNGEKPPFITVNVWDRVKYFSVTRKILDYVSTHVDEQFNLSKMAAVACMEPTALSRSFRQKAGITLHAFLEAYRVSKTAEMMSQSDFSITEIAFATGFNSLATFERSFKKVVGTTPSRYRVEILRKNGILPVSQSTSD